MPQTDTPFVIGVIREKEKEFLEEDEFTRIRHAATMQDSIAALNDTAYGLYLAGGASFSQALVKRLKDELEWLKAMLGSDKKFIWFITSRYDALHIATALKQFHDGEETAQNITDIGSLSDELLTSTIWHNTGWEGVPEFWREFIREEAALAQQDDWRLAEMLARVQEQLIVVMNETGNTPLTKKLTDITEETLKEELELRPDNLPENVLELERKRDEDLLTLLRPYRAEPVHEDAIVAWWYALTMENRVLRMLFTGKGGGVDPQKLETLTRTLYRTWL